jgi:hypothetical protein
MCEFACHQLFIQCGKFTEDMTPLTNGSYLLKLGENLHIFLDLQFEESDLCGHVGSLKILQGMDCDVENIKVKITSICRIKRRFLFLLELFQVKKDTSKKTDILFCSFFFWLGE